MSSQTLSNLVHEKFFVFLIFQVILEKVANQNNPIFHRLNLQDNFSFFLNEREGGFEFLTPKKICLGICYMSSRLNYYVTSTLSILKLNYF